MRELSARRKRVVVLGACVSSMSLLVLSLGRHSLWVSLPCIAVEVVVLVYMASELRAIWRE